jgi:hypothetical protein
VWHGKARRGEERRTRRRHEVRFGTATTEQARAGKDTMARCDHEADASAVCGVRSEETGEDEPSNLGVLHV